MDEKILRQNLLEFLEKGPAHVTVKDALSEIKEENRHKRPSESLHTIWGKSYNFANCLVTGRAKKIYTFSYNKMY